MPDTQIIITWAKGRTPRCAMSGKGMGERYYTLDQSLALRQSGQGLREVVASSIPMQSAEYKWEKCQCVQCPLLIPRPKWMKSGLIDATCASCYVMFVPTLPAASSVRCQLPAWSTMTTPDATCGCGVVATLDPYLMPTLLVVS